MQLPFRLALQKKKRKKKESDREETSNIQPSTHIFLISSVLGKLWGCWWMLGLAVDMTQTGCVTNWCRAIRPNTQRGNGDVYISVRCRRAHISLLEAAEACLQVYGVAEELGSAHITPRRSTSSSPTPPSAHSIHPTFPPSAARRQRLRRSAGNSPSICFLHFCFSLPKGQVLRREGVHCHPDPFSPSHLPPRSISFRRENVVSRPPSSVSQPCYPQWPERGWADCSAPADTTALLENQDAPWLRPHSPLWRIW